MKVNCPFSIVYLACAFQTKFVLLSALSEYPRRAYTVKSVEIPNPNGNAKFPLIPYLKSFAMKLRKFFYLLVNLVIIKK